MTPYRPRHPQWPWAGALAAVVVSLTLLSFVLLLFDTVAPAATPLLDARAVPAHCAGTAPCPAATLSEVDTALDP